MSELSKIQAFFEQEFPDSGLVIESITEKGAILKRAVTSKDLRPGGTVSGPFMMTLADAALYAAIFGELGLITLAVTTSFSINFLNKPAAEHSILAECKLLKVGRQLVVGEVTLYSEGSLAPIAHAVGTYSIPRRD